MRIWNVRRQSMINRYMPLFSLFTLFDREAPAAPACGAYMMGGLVVGMVVTVGVASTVRDNRTKEVRSIGGMDSRCSCHPAPSVAISVGSAVS